MTASDPSRPVEDPARTGAASDGTTAPETGTGTSTSTGTGAGGRSALLGAVFLMATSATVNDAVWVMKPGPIALGAAFACAIVLSILVDIAVQMNVWRVIGVSGRRAHELGNSVLPGVGYALTALVVAGGLVFNIGNIAGSGLGTDAMFGLDPRIGGALSAAVAIASVARIISTPSATTTRSRATPALRLRKIAMLPMLKTRPPATTSAVSA